MNQRQVEVFQAVMTTGTASRAAQILRISQPAVSKAIQELERSVGFALFFRTKGRLLPTEEARQLYREVEASFVGMAKLRSAAARIKDFGSGEIRVACLSALSTTILPKALSAFHRRHPKVAISLHAPLSSVVRDLVANGSFDLGLAADEIDLTGVDFQPYTNYRAVLALHPGHPLEHFPVVRPSDLDGLPFIALAPEDTTRRQSTYFFDIEAANPRIVLETPFSTTICAMVRAGMGCGIVHPLTAEVYRRDGLVLKPFEPAVYFRTLLLTPPNRPPSMILRDLIEELGSYADLRPEDI